MKAGNPKQLIFKMLADREMTQADLAAAMGISRQAVSQAFRSALSFKRLHGICEALGFELVLQARDVRDA